MEITNHKPTFITNTSVCAGTGEETAHSLASDGENPSRSDEQKMGTSGKSKKNTKIIYEEIAAPGEVVGAVVLYTPESDSDEVHILGVRHLVVLSSLFAIVLAYVLRVNMSVAIVSMTDRRRLDGSQVPIYKWNEKEKSAILSSFFWGYIIFPIWFGNLAEKYGAYVCLTIGMFTSSLFTVMVPYCASCGYLVMCVLRGLEGVAQSSFFPSTMVLLSKWIPPDKRAQALTIAYSGMSLGTLISFPLSGFLASTEFGWPSIFYVTGGMGFLWVLVWLFIGASSPSRHTFISELEERFIQETLTNIYTTLEKQNMKTPWKEILTSAPVWAVTIVHWGQNWGYFTLLTEIPNYMRFVLKVDIKQNGVLSSLPYICGWLSAILFSWVSHRIQESTSVSRTVQRKVWTSMALLGGAVVILILGLSNTRSITVTVALLVSCIALNAGVYPGFLTSHVDISPNFCGTLMGFSNTLANTASILGPLVVGWFVDDARSQSEWKNVFVLSSVITIVTNLIYVIFGSSEVQSWNVAPSV